MSLTRADFGLTPKGRQQRMRRIGDAVVAEWKAIAREKLGRRSRGPYLRSIGITDLSEDRVVVSLPGTGEASTAVLALIVELGMGPGGIGTQGAYDVRTHLLKASASNVRWGKNGPYLNVPFNRTVAAIQSMGGRAAVAAAQSLIRSFNGRAPAAGPEGSGRMLADLAPRLKPHHIADPLEGMIRLASTYSRGVVQTTGYRLWRRASWAGQPWLSQGVKARHLAAEVDRAVPELVREAL